MSKECYSQPSAYVTAIAEIPLSHATTGAVLFDLPERKVGVLHGYARHDNFVFVLYTESTYCRSYIHNTLYLSW